MLILKGVTLSDDSCVCRDWIPYKDEKCFKVINRFVTNSEAQNICQQSGGILAIIRTEEEQNLIKEYIETMKVVDNIWIGIKQNANDSFEWIDGTDMKYTNWAKDRPLYTTGLDCAVISVDFVRRPATDWDNFGKWLDVNCMKKICSLPENSTMVNDKIARDSNCNTKESH